MVVVWVTILTLIKGWGRCLSEQKPQASCKEGSCLPTALLKPREEEGPNLSDFS